jgi:hypothetical protein
MVGEHAAHKVAGDLGQHGGRRDRLIQRDRTRDGAEIGKAHAHRHRAARPRLGA